MKPVEFSEDEANALLQIIDDAIRATGLKHAANGGFLAAKIRAPFQVTAPPVVANDEAAAA